MCWKATYATRASVNYKIWLNYFIQVCGDRDIEEYGIQDWIKYKHWLEQHYSACSVQFATVSLKNFFKFYSEEGFKCLKPSLIKIPRILNAQSHRAVTEEEYKRIVAEIPQNEFRHLRDLIAIRLLWDTGVRVSELRDLDVKQIDENKRYATIQTKKTGKPRTIVWSEETHALLMKYMPIRIELQQVNKATTALFLGWEKSKGWSTRLNIRTVQRTIKYYASRAGINEKITPHSFRHGWAHYRRDQNAPLAFIQKGLGHISPVSTFVYEQYNDTEFVGSAQRYLKIA